MSMFANNICIVRGVGLGLGLGLGLGFGLENKERSKNTKGTTNSKLGYHLGWQ